MYSCKKILYWYILVWFRDSLPGKMVSCPQCENGTPINCELLTDHLLNVHGLGNEKRWEYIFPSLSHSLISYHSMWWDTLYSSTLHTIHFKLKRKCKIYYYYFRKLRCILCEDEFAMASLVEQHMLNVHGIDEDNRYK